VSKARGRNQRSKRRGSTRGRWLAALGLVLLLASSAAAGAWFWSKRANTRGEAVTFDVVPGEREEALAERLELANLARPAWSFALYLRATGGVDRLQPGPHLLRRGLSPAQLVARLARTPARPTVKVTIVEGFNRYQVAERLQKLDVASAALFLARTEDAARLAELGVPGPTAEGYLFPATYDLHVDSNPDLVFATFVHEARRRLERLFELKPERLDALRRREGWGERELLTLASIVEKEAADRHEHGTIASVFYNRLDDETFRPRRMLQSDATAIYGCLVARAEVETCRDFTGRVTPAMLRDASNPYNTYKHPGLPPGPIGNPSESAIVSVLDPPKTPYFFFVAGVSKRHVFSRSLAEHERAIVTGVPGTSGAPLAGD
jgi:UPF0755 protein